MMSKTLRTVSRCLPPVLALSLLVVDAPPARAVPPAADRIEDVVRVLRARANPTRAELSVAGEEAGRILVDLLVARKIDAELRVRAARALVSYPSERTRAVLVSMVPNREEPSSLRAVVMESLARIRGTRAVDDLLPWLKDPDPVLRAGAGRALGETGDERACSVLVDSLGHEEGLEVRMAIEEGIAACRRGRKP